MNAVNVKRIAPPDNAVGVTRNSPWVNICDEVITLDVVNHVNNTDVIVLAVNVAPIMGVTSIYPNRIPAVFVPSLPVNFVSKYANN